MRIGREITPDMLRVEDFLPDYERLFQNTEDIGQDAFWTAEPYTAIPWMEAILGCRVVSGEESFVSKPWMASLDDVESLELDPDNPWLRKYLEFTDRLVELSDGRFPVGMPIMRGPADVAGALLGQAEMVLQLYDEEEAMRRFFLKIADIYSRIAAMQKERTPLFHGGETMGLYHLWTPGKCTWYQEDLSTLLSPPMYDTFLREAERRICSGCDYTMIHLHPASFFILDQLLENDWLRAVQVNKDVGGPSVVEMMPELRKIAEKKNLVLLLSDLTREELDCLRDELPPSGVFFFVTIADKTDAVRLLTEVRSWNG